MMSKLERMDRAYVICYVVQQREDMYEGQWPHDQQHQNNDNYVLFCYRFNKFYES